MEVLKSISPDVLLAVFGWSSENIETAAALFNRIDIRQSHTIPDTSKYPFEKMFFDVSEYLFHHTRELSYRLEHIDSIPDGSMQYTRNVIYKAPALSASGSWAEIDLSIFFNGIRGVIKHLIDERPVDELIEKDNGDFTPNIPLAVVARRKQKYGKLLFFTQSVYELVIQVYISMRVAAQKTKYTGLMVPRIYWVRRTRENTLDAFMQRAPGIFLASYRGNILLALAHVMKHLWTLQLEEQFMHRDFHAGNVSFAQDTLEVGIIDFGMACVNPNRAPVAWQSNTPDFYHLNQGAMAAACTNRSMDVVCLIASLECSKRNDVLTAEYQNMLSTFERILLDAPRHKRAPFEDRNSGFFTLMRGRWHIGNVIGCKSQQHFWTYNMIEFPCVNWYPEHFLSRLLRYLPIKNWFPIRKNISEKFDHIMPNDVYLKRKGQSLVMRLIKLEGPKVYVMEKKGKNKKLKLMALKSFEDLTGHEVSLRYRSLIF
jgi:hypothetical protein